MPETQQARLLHTQTYAWLVANRELDGRSGRKLPYRQEVLHIPRLSGSRTFTHTCHSPVVPTPRRSLFTTDPFKPRDEAGKSDERQSRAGNVLLTFGKSGS